MRESELENLYIKKFRFIKAFMNVLKMGFQVSPLHFLLFIAIDIVNSILVASMTYFSERFFSVVRNSDTYSLRVIQALIVLCAVIILQHVTNGIGHSVIPALKYKMDRDAIMRLNNKMLQFPTMWFENQDFLNFVEKAYRGTEYSFSVLVPMLRFLFKYGPYCVIMGIYLYHLEPVLALCILFIFLPMFFTTAFRPQVLFNLEDQSAPIRRECDHYKKCITAPEYFKETRTLGIYSFFKDRFSESIGRLNRLTWNAELKIKLLETCTTIITALGYGGVIALLVSSLLKGHITVAMFAAVFASITTMHAMCDDTAYHFLTTFDGMSTVQNFLALLDVDVEEKENKEMNYNKGVKFDHVSFSYIGSDKLALDDVSFEIKPKETIAVVGINGSGKSTFSKLLLGLYTPTSGSVKIGGVDTKDVDRDSCTKGMSAVFQKFQKYKMSLADNVCIGDCQNSGDKKLFDDSLRQAGVAIDQSKLTDGVDTMLSRDFDGVELSGGQWQRIAIARGLFRNRDIIVLDEPTSAIDPIEESRLYEEFADISKDKTSIMITHRIASSKIADRIFVMNEGKLVESGTQEELMNQNGLYRQLFDAQRQWYQ